ncbi:Hint domain-containing protein [Tateyamaria armeniaca]|uniref:Hint domain-containing protein n=1 Tax=Tateyamaria armeniaca TaxID=2518930 RepID=A0ABW8UTA3_9RHOB
MADTSAASDGAALKTRGLLAGGHIATAMGWRPVEAIAAGDLVLTFDHGLRPVMEVHRETFWVADMMAPASYASVFVPSGALGNSQDLELLPDQGVLIESEAACDAHGDPFAIVPAKALAGYRGISRIESKTRIEVITLVFERAEVIYAQGGALVHCPPVEVRISDIGLQKDIYDVIPADEARFLVECMMVEDGIVAAA